MLKRVEISNQEGGDRLGKVRLEAAEEVLSLTSVLSWSMDVDEG
jgi:hypothetical protein